MKSTICLAEDRERCEPSLRLLLLSLNAYCPEATVNLFYPPAKDRFLAWVKKLPQVRLQTDQLKCGYGWNVKPQAMMQLIDEGFDEVIWIDTDIIVNRNPFTTLSSLSRDTIAVADHTLAQERWDPNALRARSWGLPVGRVLPVAVNSGVVRVTQHHYDLLLRWWELLQSPEYQEFQHKPWRERPFHMLGDQDVLTALLTSNEFSRIPIHILKRGKDIIQFDGVYGYTVAERMRNLLGGCPAFVHSMAGKPWSERWQIEPAGSLREYLKMIYLDVSPYTLSAIRFKDDVGCDTEWMEPHYLLSRILRALGLDRPELAGFPIAVCMEPARITKWLLRK
jgi:hypothetical protein